MKTRLIVAAGLAPLLVVTALARQQPWTPPARSHHPDIPYQSPTSLGAASYAKILCSAVFVSGREVEEVRRNSAYFLMAEPDRTRPISVNVDREKKRVQVTVQDVTRAAAFYGDQGCVIHPVGEDGIHFTPVPVKTTLPDAASQPWPMGDAPSNQPWPAGLDRAGVQAAVDMAFADPEGLTAAMVVVYKGQIVGERYMPGIAKDTQLESWSMGKSLTATLVGLVVKDGAFGLDDPAPVPDWRRPGDPRGTIRVRDVMQMSSGLSFTGQDDRWMNPETAVPRPLLHLRRRGERVSVRHQLAGRIRARHRRALPQLRPDDARLPRAAGRAEEGRGLPLVAATRAVRPDRHPPPGPRDRPLGQLPAERLRLRHGAELGATRAALPARRHVERATASPRWVDDVRQHPCACVAPEGVRRAVLGERRGAMEPAAQTPISCPAPVGSTPSSSPHTTSWWCGWGTSVGRRWARSC